MTKHAIVAICIFLICFVIFTLLLIYDQILNGIYLSLFSVLAFSCIVIALLPRLKEIDFKNLRTTLVEIKKTKKEIFAKEESLKEIALRVSELIKANATFASYLSDEEDDKLQNEFINSKINNLLHVIGFSENTFSQINTIEKALKKAEQSGTVEEREKNYKEYKNILRREIQKKR